MNDLLVVLVFSVIAVGVIIYLYYIFPDGCYKNESDDKQGKIQENDEVLKMSEAKKQEKVMNSKKFWLNLINKEIYRAEKAERKAKKWNDKADICRRVARDMLMEYERRFESEVEK